jgi:hypothetical protein
VTINDRFVVVSIPVAVTIFLDDCGISIPMVIPVANNCPVVVPVAIPVVMFAHRYADRPDTNSNFFRTRRHCYTNARNGGNHQSIPHTVLLDCCPER